MHIRPRVYLENDRYGQPAHKLLDLDSITNFDNGCIRLDFVNSYEASMEYAGFNVVKTMHGKDMAEGDFGFSIEPNNPDSLIKMYSDRDPGTDLHEESMFSSPAAKAEEAAVMGPKLAVRFNQSDIGKTFEYRVFEDVDPLLDESAELDGVQVHGVTYDRSGFIVRIVPSDRGDGAMQTVTTVERVRDKVTGAELPTPELVGEFSSVDGPMPVVPFENSYAVAPVKADAVLLDKAIAGRDWQEGDAFRFRFVQTKFHDEDGNMYDPGQSGYVAGPSIDDVTVTMDDDYGLSDGTRRFGFEDAEFVSVGMYRYEVSEVVPDDAVNADGVKYSDANAEQKKAGGFSKSGLTYSDEKARVSVSVWEHQGRLIAEPIVSAPDQGSSAHFTNVYDAGGGSAPAEGEIFIKGEKRLTGRDLVQGEFSFALNMVPFAADRPVLPVGASVNAADGTFSFDPIAVTVESMNELATRGYAVHVDAQGSSAWKVRYRVVEDASSLPDGVSVSRGSFDVDVVVVDGGDGFLRTTLSYPQQGAFIDNAYSAGEPVEFAPHGSKVLSCAEGLAPADIAGKFTFVLEGADGAPMPDAGGRTATNDAAGNIDFGAICFSQDMLADVTPAEDGSRSKTFTYRVTESTTPGADTSGITNDPQSVKEFQVVLTDDGKGALSVTSTADEGVDFCFVNVYDVSSVSSSVTDAVEIGKVLDGRPLRDHEFEFVMVEGDTVVAKASNDAEGRVVFPALTYSEPGVHMYTSYELADGGDDGIVYDEAVYTVRTAVVDGGNGALSVSHEVFDAQGASLDAVTFENACVDPSAPVVPRPEDPSVPNGPSGPSGPSSPSGPSCPNEQPGSNGPSGPNGQTDQAVGDSASSGAATLVATNDVSGFLALASAAIAACAAVVAVIALLARRRS